MFLRWNLVNVGCRPTCGFSFFLFVTGFCGTSVASSRWSAVSVACQTRWCGVNNARTTFVLHASCRVTSLAGAAAWRCLKSFLRTRTEAASLQFGFVVQPLCLLSIYLCIHSSIQPPWCSFSNLTWRTHLGKHWPLPVPGCRYLTVPETRRHRKQHCLVWSFWPDDFDTAREPFSWFGFKAKNARFGDQLPFLNVGFSNRRWGRFESVGMFSRVGIRNGLTATTSATFVEEKTQSFPLWKFVGEVNSD